MNTIGRHLAAATLVLSCGLAAVPLSAGTVDGVRTGHAGPLVESGPIVVRGESGLTIRDVSISNPSGPCVLIENAADIRLINVRLGPCADEGVRAVRVYGLSVVLSTIEDAGKGVYALDSRRVRVVGNDLLGLGRNTVQFDKVNGPHSLVWRNYVVTEAGNAETEDLVSLYRSNGQPFSPIRVYRNRFKGGGSSRSGSGLLLGDEGGSNQVASFNSLVGPGQVGIGVASGTGISVRSNRVLQGVLPWSNVGMYVWNQAPEERCRDIEFVSNQVSWLDRNGLSRPWYDAGNCGPVRLVDNDFDAALTESIFDD